MDCSWQGMAVFFTPWIKLTADPASSLATCHSNHLPMPAHPASTFLQFVFNVDEAESGKGRTTLMIRNIPNKVGGWHRSYTGAGIIHSSGWMGCLAGCWLNTGFSDCLAAARSG